MVRFVTYSEPLCTEFRVLIPEAREMYTAPHQDLRLLVQGRKVNSKD